MWQDAQVDTFTPIASGIGGALIGLSAAILLFANGRIAGISGIAGGLLDRTPPDGHASGERGWRAAFLIGLVSTGAIGSLVAPSALAVTIERPTWIIVAAGLLVGVGTQLGSGCTSGHGVCGISRWSIRSIVATITFVATAMATVFVARQLGVG